jgi:hypothetical protein
MKMPPAVFGAIVYMYLAIRHSFREETYTFFIRANADITSCERVARPFPGGAPLRPMPGYLPGA